MSHRPERKEKNCLNCGTIVQGRFCQACGQENLEPKETFWGMVSHFFNDITHFDGKFFTTLKILALKPGFLSLEYMKGRRAAYLNPVRMYVFTSAIFFLIFFSVNENKYFLDYEDKPFTPAQRMNRIANLKDDLKEDSVNAGVLKQLELLADTSRILRASDLAPFRNTGVSKIKVLGGSYQSLKHYDSIQASLPSSKRDGWFRERWNRKTLHVGEQFRNNGRKSVAVMMDILIHMLPYLLFVSLPFFAFILKLLYLRSRKKYYFADHGIFTIHHYIFSFLLLLLLIIFGKLKDATGWALFDILLAAGIIWGGIYLYKEMKRFYGQGRGKTFLKFLLLNLLGLIVLTALFAVFTVVSVFQV